MAQMFSSGVTPEYLKSLSDAYAQYFPQQQPVNIEALQQWYSPSGSSAFAAPMAAPEAPSVAPSVVGSLFGEQYPQVQQGGGGSFRATMGEGDTSGMSGDFSGLSKGLSSLGSIGLFGPLGKLAALAYGAYNRANPYGTAPTMSDAGLAAAISGQDVANARDTSTGGGGYGGVATGGYGGDASGGGDRGTRGGF